MLQTSITGTPAHMLFLGLLTFSEASCLRVESLPRRLLALIPDSEVCIINCVARNCCREKKQSWREEGGEAGGGLCFLGGNILPRTLINKAEGAELPICDLLDVQERWQERVTGRAGQTLVGGQRMMEEWRKDIRKQRHRG